jgi:septum site-determining protein MinC
MHRKAELTFLSACRSAFHAAGFHSCPPMMDMPGAAAVGPSSVHPCIHPVSFFMPKTQVRKPIEIKISTVVAVAAILRNADLAVLDAAMREMTGGAPDYFDGEFVIVDIGSLDAQHRAIDWAALIALFASYRLKPVAVRNAAPGMEADIAAHGLTLDTEPVPRAAPAPEPAPAPASAPVPAAPAALAPAAVGSMIVDTPVRAGQRIYAQGRDLVIMAAVNNGAEVIADGSIHVYAPLRGRALAGASGDPNARIFAMSMEAELVSIAGLYRTFEDGLPKDVAQQPAQVRLAGDRLDIAVMSSFAR